MSKRLLTDYFKQDHERLDELFQHFCEARTDGWSAARQCFGQFEQAQRRHIELEEELMFPLYERRAGQPGHRPIDGMWREPRAWMRKSPH